MISAEGLVKRFIGPPPVVAVDGVSFTAGPGEVLGLLGPNGAGKTTTLRMLATLLVPDEGTIRVCGHEVRAAPARVRASLGYLSASTHLYGRLTAREVLLYFARLQGVAEPGARVDALIERFEMGPFANVRCDRLSTGMRQKVSIARAVVHDPPVLVFDEPTNGLDVLVAQTVLSYVEEARRSGKCVVYSTHIMSEAARLCDRLAIVHQGRLWATGTVEELRARTGVQDLDQVFIRLIEPTRSGRTA